MADNSIKKRLEKKFRGAGFHIPEFLLPTISPLYAVSTKKSKKANILILNMARELKEGRSILSKKEDRWNSKFFPATPTQYYSGKHSLSKDDLVESNFEWILRRKFLNGDSNDVSKEGFLFGGNKYLEDYKLKRDGAVSPEKIIFHNFFVRPMKKGFNDRIKRMLPRDDIKKVFKENGVDDRDLDKSKQLLQYILDTAKPDIVVVPGDSLRTWLSNNLKKDYFKQINFIILPYSYFEIALFKNDNDLGNYLLQDPLKIFLNMLHIAFCKNDDDEQKWKTEFDKILISIQDGEKKFNAEIINYQYDDFPLDSLLRCETAMMGLISYLFYKKFINMIYPGWVPGLKDLFDNLCQSVDFIIDNNVPKPSTKAERKQTEKGRKAAEKNRRKNKKS